MAKFLVADTAGFCFGVDRAVEIVNDLIKSGEKVATLGPIIHNTRLVSQLEEQGVRTIDNISDAASDEVVVIRSHGVGKEIYETLKFGDIKYKDATCPYVSKIHRIVEQIDETGIVLIAGDENHPEVTAIAKHCKGSVYYFSDQESLKKIVENIEGFETKDVIMVSQTTFNIENYKKCRQLINRLCTNVTIFDTICSATSLRQQEAAKLASQCDLMVVIGDKKSSNTAKLYDLCQSHTDTILVQGGHEVDPEVLKGKEVIAVTSGASTPASIIEEVLKTMSETVKEFENQEAVTEETAVEAVTEEAVVEAETVEVEAEETETEETETEEVEAEEVETEEVETEEVETEGFCFEEALEKSLKIIKNGEKVIGLVVGMSATEVFIDVGTKHAGFVALSELTDDQSVNAEDVVKKGDEINLVVVRVNDVEGTVQLSKRRYDAIEGYEKVAAAADDNSILDAVVTEVIKGGLVVTTNGVKVFVPASQATLSRNDVLEELVKKPVQIRIIEKGRGRRRSVGSIKSVLLDARKELAEVFWASVEVGGKYTGPVKSLTSYGAFVDLGGVDGMVHISELSWKRIHHPNQVVNVGDVIEVYIRDIDEENKKISLGYRKTEDNPFEIFKTKFAVGDVIEGKVVSLTDFGAFVEIIDGVDGLVHVSQISNERVNKASDVLTKGQDVTVKITDIDIDGKRISLSIKALLSDEAPVEAEEAAPEVTEEAAPEVIEEVVPEVAEEVIEETAE